MKKLIAILMAAVLIVGLLAGCGSSSDTTDDAEDTAQTEAADDTAQDDSTDEEDSSADASETTDFPTENISVIVPFAAGGGTDNVARPLATLAQDILGVSLVIDNVTGASGATGAQQVYDSDADGYSLLFSAENVCIYDALDISDLTYEDFDPLFVVGSEEVCLIVSADSEFETITDLIEYSLENPGNVTIPVAGAAGLAAISCSLVYAATGAEWTQVPSDGDSDALIQLLGGSVTVAIGKLSTISSYLESGDVRALCSFTTERLDVLEDVPAITEEYPEFEEFLPWGSFYAVFAPAGTPDDVKEVLISAFAEAFTDEDYQTFLTENAITPLGLEGDEATEYLDNYRKSVCTALITAGTSTKTAEELGIE